MMMHLWMMDYSIPSLVLAQTLNNTVPIAPGHVSDAAVIH